MDNLFKQTRLGLSGTDHETREDIGSSKDRRIPLQKTQSFKDKKKEPNWFRKQVTWKMSQDNESEKADEQAMAVAAAAYAITSLAELRVSEHKRASKASTVPIKSKKEDPSIPIPDRGKKISEITQIAMDAKKPEKALLHTPSFKKTASTLDKQLGGSLKQSSGGGTSKQRSESFKRGSTLKTDAPTTPKVVPQLDIKRKNSSKTGMGKSQADIWEETESSKITERYKAQNSTILSWEEKRKVKAKRQLDKAERELERKRTNALAKYRRDIQSIDQVVGGAKAKAEEKKKNDELKVKEKANKIRKAGKVPSTSCF